MRIKNKLFFYLLIWSFNQIPFTFEIITLPISINKYNLLYINICIGSTPICKSAKITFDERFLRVYNTFGYKFNESTSSVFLEERDTSFLIADDISFLNNNNIPAFELKNCSLVYDETTFGKDKAFIGLGYDVKRKDNLLETIFETIKERNIFYINIPKKQIVFGNYPSVYYELLRFKSDVKRCPMLPSTNILKKGYYFNFDSIYFKNKDGSNFHYIVDEIANISPRSNMIYVSRNLMKQIIENYFNKAILDNECRYISDSSKLYLECKETFNVENNNNLHDITFIFGNASIRLHPKDLFMTIGDGLYFMIAFFKNTEVNSFGFPLLKRYTIVYDIENKQILFTPNY